MLHDQARRNPGLFARMRVVQLDEWGGLPGHHGASCQAYLRAHLIQPLGIEDTRFLSIDGAATDPDAECDRVARQLAAWGGVGLALLGLGINGHVGFCEPSAPTAHLQQANRPALRGVHAVELSAASQAHAMVAGRADVPSDAARHGLTLGLRDLTRARQLVLLVLGEHKAEVLRKVVSEPICASRPASIALRECVGEAHLVGDRAALSLL